MLGKQIGIIRNTDVLGRFVIPKEIVSALGWGGKMFGFAELGGVITVSVLSGNRSGRKLDQLNRLVIPKNMRRCLDIKEGTPLEMFFFENGVTLRVWEGGMND